MLRVRKMAADDVYPAECEAQRLTQTRQLGVAVQPARNARPT